ncbi:MAG: chromosome partitioning protein ParB [Roseovarius sp.]|nr:chromosome partitioning protein ParB [Roseovarius sp.]|tara:strand:+ start:2973 stop:3278 length:306 start_codon:yes stop_codon:yes gene_type:complete
MSGSNRLAGLKARPKDTTVEEVRRVDEVGEARGFLDRTPRKKPGRKPSPRTHQLHPKVFPEIGEAIAAEAERLGVTQGQLVEKMWSLYEAIALQNKENKGD